MCVLLVTPAPAVWAGEGRGGGIRGGVDGWREGVEDAASSHIDIHRTLSMWPGAGGHVRPKIPAYRPGPLSGGDGP